MAPDEQPPNKPNKPATDPTRVREPDNTRPASEPVPRRAPDPQQAKEPEAEGKE